MLAVGMRRQLAPYDGKTQVAEGLWTGQFLDVAPPSSTPGSFAIRTLSRDPGSVVDEDLAQVLQRGVRSRGLPEPLRARRNE
ncbi:uncharacterized protein PHACADRAFT_202470 [Phanerochaete carnosa HHB-10118-sp]|uniref:Uncharacterized protein n=1 Tax=Phanerochaete carnosa (strain HHB-10118-sp) TaxID=650164 RepID=K5VQ62_PHACS|nr:uncharacterized protein PHACADRAFT_202470 [Phanerochaete carnosa HHB-10118-sp]EKM48734.1 hypothetical protein PHACADRAFT_202470 [Phanerochaete carnosa HHB-10118-sp]